MFGETDDVCVPHCCHKQSAGQSSSEKDCTFGMHKLANTEMYVMDVDGVAVWSVFCRIDLH